MNVISSMLFGQRYDIDDPELETLLTMNDLIVEGSKAGNLVAFIPWLRHIPIYKPYQSLKKAVEIRNIMIAKKVDEHLRTYDADNIRDFTDSLIKYSKDPEILSRFTEINNNHFDVVLFDIILAGGETTFTTLRWCVLYLLHYPKYQDLLYNEIIQTIGTERYPKLKDRQTLPLVQAVIQEVLRMSSILELGISHKATQDGTIGGENVPKGTHILFNIWNIHHDEREWDNPHEFDPSRWLDEEGNYYPGKHKSYIPFSLGKRSCLGESMAKTELFLFLARLVRDFKFIPNVEDPFPKLDRVHGIICTPLPYKIILRPRD